MAPTRSTLRTAAGLLAAVACGSAVLVLLSSRQLQWTIAHDTIKPLSGRAHIVDLAVVRAPTGYHIVGDTNERPHDSSLMVYRDGVALGPAHSVHETIVRSGGGAFSHWHDTLYFSTPEASDPRTDGHVYSIRLTPTLHENLRVSLIAVAIVLGATTVWLLLPLLTAHARSVVLATKLFSVTTFVALALSNLLWPVMNEAQRLQAAGRWTLLGIYLLANLAASIALVTPPFIRDWRVRVPAVLLLGAALGIDRTMLAVSGRHMSLDMMETFMRERAMAGTVLTAYASSISQQALIATCLALALTLPPPRRLELTRRIGLLTLGALATTAGIIFETRGGIESFPSPIAVPAHLIAATALSATTTTVDRNPIEYARPLTPAFTKIVMVVDESVRGDYLALNNPALDNTPTLLSAGDALMNYGVAVSAANCSVAARLIMRVGLQPHQLPDTRGVWRRLPTIWQFAKKAGYTTALVDAWRPPGEYHSYMDAEEARAVDMTESTVTEPEYARDSAAAARLVDLLRRREPMFIYVNKNGTHPDYAHQFPPGLDYDPSALVASLTLGDTRKQAVANYHKAIRWSVDGFFERVLPELRRDDVILIYTSDHGQSLYQGGYDLSHCSLTADLHRGEVMVPLFIVGQGEAAQAMFAREARRAYNRASHFDVLPTLLELMGYAPEWVRSAYGSSLANVPLDRKRGFLMGTFDHPAAVWIATE